MGFIYVGRSSHGWKIGETNQRFISSRIASIRQNECDFQDISYIRIPNSTGAMTKAIESHTRLTLERKGYINTGLDHFTPHDSFEAFKTKALKAAKAYCNFMRIEYIE